MLALKADAGTQDGDILKSIDSSEAADRSKLNGLTAERPFVDSESFRCAWS